MAYIESHQELRDHPKTKRAARMLSIGIPQMIGHLQMLWWWSLDYAEDGDLSGYDAYDLADAGGWDGDPELFATALVECGVGGGCGFLETDWKLHDWDDYAGKLIRIRRANRERQRRYRDRQDTNKEETETSQPRNGNVTRDKRVSHGAILTKQNKAKQREEKSLAPKTARAREPDPLFEAIAECWKGEPYRAGLLSPSQASLVGKATAEIKAIRGSPADVPAEWASLRERFDNPTPAALAKHWGTNGTGPKHDDRNGLLDAAEQRIIRREQSRRAHHHAGDDDERPALNAGERNQSLDQYVPGFPDG